MSEITFKNEKFNILKPTVHIITDHFKDFILQRRNEDFGRIFLDRNGFRHVWEGMETFEGKSLRKTELVQQKNEKQIEKQNNSTKNTVQKIKDKPRRKKKIKEDEYVPEIETSLRGNPTLVTTTFFCPFFGLIKMTSEIDNFEETKHE